MYLRNILLNVIQNRFLPILTRLRYWLSPTYVLLRFSQLIRDFLQKMTDVRPRSKDDYYPVARWLVSKRLAYAAVIITGVLCLVYIFSSKSALFPGRSDAYIKTYKYNSILLKFAKGKVRIRAKSGYIGYEGDVSNAACNGDGTLMNPDGIVVYEGTFANNKYEGTGKQFYGNGSLKYAGTFHENLYDGKGKLYRASGTPEYDGEFSRNMKEGEGILYNTAGDSVFSGSFSKDEVLYSSLIGKSSSEMAACYSGERKLYSADNERVRMLADINAMTEEILDDDSIDEDAKVQTVYVLSNQIPVGDYVCKTFDDLGTCLGEPTYVGESYATLPELLAINFLNERSGINVINGPADIKENDLYTEYTKVDDFQDDYRVYLHSYKKDGLVYNFVSSEGDSHFSFYYVLTNTADG